MPDQPYNLLRERWIPVRDEAGHIWNIAPHEMTTVGPNGTMPVALAAARPDFNGALIQFLIGLIQTACPPETERDWRHWFKELPGEETLRAAFARFEWAFNLDGCGPRFMQDFDTLDAKSVPITNLLIDAPTGKTLDDNKDHFLKDISSQALPPAAAAMALCTLQINAPSGGQGHRTSLRGGGPLTTIVVGKTLWQTVWLNVLTKTDFEALLGSPQELLVAGTPEELAERAFPWLLPTRTSTGNEHPSSTTTSDDVHPLQMYWATPRRIRLTYPQDAANSDLSEDAIHTYITKNLGANYAGTWTHPLTPYRTNPDGTTSSVKGSPSHFSYRYWLGLTVNDPTNDVRPARVVRLLQQRITYKVVREALLDGSATGRQVPLWAFGYDMDNMKARRWHESHIRLVFALPQEDGDFNRARFEEARADIEELAAQFVAAAAELVGILRKALAEALYPASGRRPKGASSSSVVQDTSTRFWHDTEPHFYRFLESARQHLEKNVPDAELRHLRAEWLTYLREEHLLRLFDEVTQYGIFRGNDPRAVVQARQKLSTAARSKKLRHMLGLLDSKHES